MNDQSIMPWGKHKGVEMGQVPDQYLLWLYTSRKAKGDVLEYIIDNLEAIALNLGKDIDKIEEYDTE